MAKLTLSFKHKKLKIYPLQQTEFIIGRDPACNISIDSLAVQPRHARVFEHDGDFRIECLQSESPLHINHKLVTEPTLLCDGDEIQVGKHCLNFSSEPSTEGVQIAYPDKTRLSTGWLQIMSGTHLGRTIRLDRAMTRIGKTGNAAAMIARRGDGYYLSHLEGDSTPRVNALDIGENSQQLRAGDQLRIGDLQLHFYLDGQESGQESSQETAAMTDASPPGTELEEQRRFTRFRFDAAAVLSKDGHEWHSTLIDISLKGALIQQPKNWRGQLNEDYQLSLMLDADTRIHMDVTVAHSEDNHLGLACRDIDLESITHLRRLVELNLGDAELLERELLELG